MGSSLPTGDGAVVGSVPVPIVSMSSQLVIPRPGCTPALPASASPARFIFDQQTETVKLSRGVNKLKSCPFSESARSAGEKRDGTTVDPGALETCGVKQPSEAAYLERKRAQRIPSWPGADNAPAEAEYICADQPARPQLSLAEMRRTIHLLRRNAPLTRRSVAYFRSGAHIGADSTEQDDAVWGLQRFQK